MIVVVDAPGFDLPGLLDRSELVNVQAFIAKPPVEGFTQAIIGGLSGACEVQQHAVCVFRPIVTARFGNVTAHFGRM